MSGVQLTDQQKLANDHNLGILIEQSVEIRHCETLSLASITLAVAVLGFAAKVVTFPSQADWGKTHSILERVRLIQDGVIAKYFYPALLVILGFTALAAHFQVVTWRSEERIVKVYEKLHSQLPYDDLTPMRDLDAASVQIKRSDRRLVATWLVRLCLISVMLVCAFVLLLGLLSLLLGT